MVQNDTCTPVYIAVLFTIAKTWKQPECPLIDEWIKMMCYIYIYIYIYIVEYYSAIRKNEIMPFATTQMYLEIIKLSQREKDKYHMISLTCRIYKQ